MKVTVLGTGDVARALAKGFLATGHQVTIGSRHPTAAKTQRLVGELGNGTTAETLPTSVTGADVVVLAVPGDAAEHVVKSAGAERLAGRILIDVTNPLDFSEKGPPRLFVGRTDSLGERIQRAAPEAKVVKAFNIVGNAHMFRPEFPGGPPDMFYCGDDPGAKREVEGLLKSFGWAPFDIGGIDGARELEPMCLLWVRALHQLNSPNMAFKLLRK